MSVAILGLSACGINTTEELQDYKWNIVSTNGESYTGEFGKSTVTFNTGNLSRGFSYNIEDNEIYLEEGNTEPSGFRIEKDGDEYNFKAQSVGVKEQYGDLTLSPSK